jgi:hypothetical protein
MDVKQVHLRNSIALFTMEMQVKTKLGFYYIHVSMAKNRAMPNVNGYAEKVLYIAARNAK